MRWQSLLYPTEMFSEGYVSLITRLLIDKPGDLSLLLMQQF